MIKYNDMEQKSQRNTEKELLFRCRYRKIEKKIKSAVKGSQQLQSMLEKMRIGII